MALSTYPATSKNIASRKGYTSLDGQLPNEGWKVVAPWLDVSLPRKHTRSSIKASYLVLMAPERTTLSKMLWCSVTTIFDPNLSAMLEANHDPSRLLFHLLRLRDPI